MGIKSQPVHLQPEMDINSGLPTNSIRVIKQDDKQRIWLGTDHGLVILNDKDSSFKNITEKVRDQQVWALEFYKEYAIIGTRFNGLFIYNLSNRQLVKHYDSASIGLCRRFRVLRDTIFIATNGTAFYLVKANENWNLTKIKSTATGGFFTDFAMWQNQVLASFYSTTSVGSKRLYQFQNDSLVTAGLIYLNDFGIVKVNNMLSLASNGNSLEVGGDGYYLILNRHEQNKSEYLIRKKPYKLFPIWDAEFVGSKAYLATGNPDNNQEGMIYEPGITSLEDLNNTFFCQSLYYDKKRKGIWAGTLNKGLFYWPNTAESYYVPKGSTSEFRFKPCDSKTGILFNYEKVYKTDLTSHEFTEICDMKKQMDNREPILDALFWNDTTAVLINGKLLILKGQNNIVKSFFCYQGNYLYKHGFLLYVFSIYFDAVMIIDLKKGTSTKLPCPSNQINATAYNGNLFYSSVSTGFHYFDTISHTFDIPFPTVESYTIQSDTLWVLNAGVLKSFKIDLRNYKLIPLFENNIKDRVSGFTPNWVLQNNRKVYCGDNKGFFTIDTKTGNPSSYSYIGNYSEGKPPTSDGTFMYFNQKNYITKLDPEKGKVNISGSTFTINILPGETIYQYTPVVIHFYSDDYIIQKHSLKEIDILKNGKLIRTLFTIDDHYEFPSGMERGNYLMRFKVNGVPVGEREFIIRIPLTSNPLFYVCISIFIIAFLAVLFRSMLSKRIYQKRILENRLQLLKQNLNPHFIFNSLNLIYSLVLQRKNEAAIKTINNFSDLHRYYLDNINKPKITIEEELKFIESYLKLEAERVEVDTPFTYQLPNNLDDHIKSVLVPPMILQPLIENAVKYCGADASVSSDSCIWIDVNQSGNKLVIGVENTTESEEVIKVHGSGSGLRLVNERIEIFNKTYKEGILLRATDSLLHCKRGYRCELVV